MKNKKFDIVKEPTSNRSTIWLAIISGIVAIIVALIQFNPWKQSVESKPELMKQQRSVIIAGTVVEASSNKSVEMAEVSIVGRTETYVTEGNGNFRIELKGEDAEEQLRIRVTKPGFLVFDKAITPPVEDLMVPLERKQ